MAYSTKNKKSKLDKKVVEGYSIENWQKYYCNIYHIDYSKNKDKISKLLLEKEKATGEKTSAFDVKEATKIVAYD